MADLPKQPLLHTVMQNARPCQLLGTLTLLRWVAPGASPVLPHTPAGLPPGVPLAFPCLTTAHLELCLCSRSLLLHRADQHAAQRPQQAVLRQLLPSGHVTQHHLPPRQLGLRPARGGVGAGGKGGGAPAEGGWDRVAPGEEVSGWPCRPAPPPPQTSGPQACRLGWQMGSREGRSLREEEGRPAVQRVLCGSNACGRHSSLPHWQVAFSRW